ncbi:MAG: 8-amino-7-oxononanoate synthase [Gammaproteobacteria bacterium]|nr:8-amino-7-oxononanoate synthase [Gammaproteobacteria bacterium]
MEVNLVKNLKKRQQLNLYRTRGVFGVNPYLSFSSNDYLGLANHPDVIRACEDGLKKYGCGSGSSQLLGGYSFAHKALEEELAGFLGYERVLLFSTGYMANLGVITTLFAGRDKSIFIDRFSHASIIDGCHYPRINFRRYKHLDVQDLNRILSSQDSKQKIIITEGVFSMDGDMAPLSNLVKIAEQNNGLLMLDDAHGIGVLGSQGRGTINYYGATSKQVPILVGTFGKSFGTFGAFVAGSKVVIESLIQFARTSIYTTSLPPAIVEATRTSLKLLQQDDWRRDHLAVLIKRFRKKACQLGLPLLASRTPIQALIIGKASCAESIAAHLKELGILVALVRPPTVPVNTSRLRISLTASHTEENIDCLLDLLNQVIDKDKNEIKVKL